MELHVVITGRKDLASQLYQQLREAIETGRLAAGTRLPPSRLLAEQLGISRKTISDTYSVLTYENFLVGKIGSGTFVNARPPIKRPKQSRSEFASAEILQHWQELKSPIRHPSLEGTSRYDFIGGATSKNQFPEEQWRRCTQYALRKMSNSLAFIANLKACPHCAKPLPSMSRFHAVWSVLMKTLLCAMARNKRWT